MQRPSVELLGVQNFRSGCLRLHTSTRPNCRPFAPGRALPILRFGAGGSLNPNNPRDRHYCCVRRLFFFHRPQLTIFVDHLLFSGLCAGPFSVGRYEEAERIEELLNSGALGGGQQNFSEKEAVAA